MGRRQVVESVNAALKGVFTDLGRGFMRVMGVTKMTVMLGFTLAAFNLDRIREGHGFSNSEGSTAANSGVEPLAARYSTLGFADRRAWLSE
jgi:hypothetical protein